MPVMPYSELLAWMPVAMAAAPVAVASIAPALSMLTSPRLPAA
jgi:hypothetical protein